MGHGKGRDSDLRALEEHLKTFMGGLSEAHYRRLEALTGIYHCLDVAVPLPPMTGFAMFADTAAAVVSEILAARPQNVLEVGSGVSTIVSAYALANAGSGKIYSLEHDRSYFEWTRHCLNDHGISEWVELVHAPLVEVPLRRGVWQWYDLSAIQLPAQIELLVIDGPPSDLQSQSRYPALPLLHANLAADATLLLDDAAREDEQDVLKMWAEDFPEWEVERLPTVKGSAFMRRSAAWRE
jgi:hypothetical protein